ncbi:phage tail family protein [Aureibacillus halotolerans]|uniref:Tail protein n=1 Tax=Aureibacillus halotolerans TaxID=1508390 RepID=A0A4R6U3A9_9BACI|nr:phage tail family protein [Aureibacillus halotolerans]TDQ39243.1 tail protein [Aureibacillus halotolerans]
MRRLTYTNKTTGESVVLSTSAPFFVSKIEGAGSPTATFFTHKAPTQMGVTYRGSTLEPRYLSLEGAVMGNNLNEIYERRARLTTVLNPNDGLGRLRYEYAGGVKEIDAVVETVDFPDRQGQPYQMFFISLMCPDPLWQDATVTRLEMSYISGKFMFPVKFPNMFSQRAALKTFINKSAYEVPIKITFIGPASNPTITNRTTGEHIRVNRELADNDILYIDTSFGNKSVTIVRGDGTRENAFNYIDLDTVFFQLVKGENKISYNSNNDSTKTRVLIEYRNRYLGV